MPLVLQNIIGFEPGGLEEALSVTGSPDATESTTVRNGIRALKCPGAATAAVYEIDVNTTGGGDANSPQYGIAVQFNNVTPTTAITFFKGLSSGSQKFSLVLKATSGDLALHDQSDTEITTASAPFIVNQWYYIEIWIQASVSFGKAVVDIDAIEKINVTEQDFTSNGPEAIELSGGTTTNEDVFFEDFYGYRGASADGASFFGNFAVKAYQSTDVGDTDQGDALADGTWALVSETPANEGTSNDAQYQDTGNLTGSTITDGGDRSGPSGDGDVTGATIKGAKYISNLKRGSGGGRVHTILHGNNVDGVTATGDLGLTTDYIIYEVLSEAAGIVPTASEYFQQGFSKSATAGQDILCGDQWAMLGYVPAAGGSTTQKTLTITAQGVVVLARASIFPQTNVVTGTGVAGFGRVLTASRMPVMTAIGAPGMARGISLTRTITATAIPTFARVATFSRTLAATAIGVAGLTKGKLFLKALSATAIGIASVVKTVGLPRAVTATGVAAVIKTVGLTRAVTAVCTATVTKAIGLQRAITAVGVSSLATIATFIRSLSMTATGVAGLVALKTFTSAHAMTATGVAGFDRVATFIRGFAVTATATPAVVKCVVTTKAIVATGVSGFEQVVTFPKTFSVTAIGVAVLAKAVTFIEIFAVTAVGVAGFSKNFISGSGAAAKKLHRFMIASVGRFMN